MQGDLVYFVYGIRNSLENIHKQHRHSIFPFILLNKKEDNINGKDCSTSKSSLTHTQEFILTEF